MAGILRVDQIQTPGAVNAITFDSTGRAMIDGKLRLKVYTTASLPSSNNDVGDLAYNSEDEVIVIWNGTEWISAGGKKLDGTSADKAALSAADIKTVNPNASDGVYWINLPSSGPTQVYCLMNSTYDGGGWMLAMKATRGTTFNWGASYWTNNNLLNESSLNLSDGDAKYHPMNEFAAKDMLAIWPDIGNGGCVSGSQRGWTWLQNNFFNGTRTTCISFWNGNDRYLLGDANNHCGIGQFSGQADVRFYGYNYRNNGSWARTRWGYGWNENGGGFFPNGNMDSDDVSGGIGMTSNFGNYSAGDRINCCQNRTGINRSARVEIWIR